MADILSKPIKLTDETAVYEAQMLPMIAKLVACGFSKPVDLAYVLGVRPSTFKAWMIDHPEIPAAMQMGRKETTKYLAAQAFREACGYEYTESTEWWKVNENGEETLSSRQVRRKYKPPNMEALTFLLTNLSDGEFKKTSFVETKSLSASLEVTGELEAAQIRKLSGMLNRIGEDSVQADEGLLVADTEDSGGEHQVSPGPSLDAGG